MFHNHGSIELPATKNEIHLLAQIDMFPENMPFFQDSLFHMRIGKYINDTNIEGDFVECGVYNGMSAAAIALGFKHKDRFIHLFDSWEGFPKTDNPKDGERAQTLAGCIKGDMYETIKLMAKTGYPRIFTCHKGWFKDTFTPEVTDTIDKIALLHVDCDFYQSVLDTLNHFYDKVVEGGIVLLDDYGAYPGCRVAFYEFCEARKIRPMLHTYDHTRAFFTKSSIVESDIDHTTRMPPQWLNYIKLLNEDPNNV